MKVTLSVIEGPHAGTEFAFDRRDNFVVGRSPTAQFRLPKKDKYFSRNHFLVEVNPPLCRLLDLDSTNGTLVNGKPVTCVDLQDGDLICGGDTLLRVSIEIIGTATISVDETFLRQQVPRLQSVDPASSKPDSSATAIAVPVATPAVPDKAEPQVKPSEYSGPQPFPSYRILKEIGRGGMGVVYKAVKEPEGVVVAIKVILPAVAASREDLAMFTREADILRKVRHRNIVPYREMNHIDGTLYLVMDFIEGQDADKLMKQMGGKLPPERAVRIASQMLEGLHYAHSQGYVHRDVKPANLIVDVASGSDRVWLADFGLARAYQASRLSGLTSVGDIAGTIRFMPPEQITNYRDVKPAADQYSAAATLYSLLTGHFVYDFPKEVQRQLLLILQEAPVSLGSRRPDLPRTLVDAVDRALSRDPKHRFPDTEAFRKQLMKSIGAWSSEVRLRERPLQPDSTVRFSSISGDDPMTLLWWAIIALVVSVLAGAMGFTRASAGAATLSQVLFGVFLVIAIILFVIALIGMGAGAAVVSCVLTIFTARS